MLLVPYISNTHATENEVIVGYNRLIYCEKARMERLDACVGREWQRLAVKYNGNVAGNAPGASCGESLVIVSTRSQL